MASFLALRGTAFEDESGLMDRARHWQPRHPRRLSDPLWESILTRVRGEFEEMPGLQLTSEEARSLLGLPEPSSGWVLERLAKDGFLFRTADGMYRRSHGGV
jgi:hypothetical protein